MMDIPDDPAIAKMMRDGPDEGIEIRCPVCGAVCDEIYLDVEGQACGCENCIDCIPSYDWKMRHGE